MSKQIIFLSSLIFICLGCAQTRPGIDPILSDQDGLLRHVVLLGFKADISKTQIQAIQDSFIRMAEQIEQTYDFEWGTNISSNNRNQGFTHFFVITFLAQEDLEQYQVHPIHEQLKADTIPYVEKLLVIDYFKK